MSFDPGPITNRDHLALRSDRNVGRWLEHVVHEFRTPDHPEILISRDGPSVGRDELVVARVADSAPRRCQLPPASEACVALVSGPLLVVEDWLHACPGCHHPGPSLSHRSLRLLETERTKRQSLEVAEDDPGTASRGYEHRMQIEVNGTGMRCSGWWHCCRSPPLVAVIHQTTDRAAVQVSPSSGRRISTPILTGPERPGSCFRVVGWHSPSDNVGRLIRALARSPRRLRLARTELQPRARRSSRRCCPRPGTAAGALIGIWLAQ